MSVFEHWCGNCQIRIYYRRHYNKDIDWQDCPYTCEYATAMRNGYSVSADTELVKHGRWVNHISENGATDGTYCSICDYEVDRNARHNYCPNCGAKMDGEKMNYDDLLRELKTEAVLFPDISAEDLADIIHALENHFCNATKDTVPVRHGHWVENDTTYAEVTKQTCTCSVCGRHSPRPLGEFCRWCGAKMDEAEE